MAARYLLDTNICIYISRQKPPQVLARFEKLHFGEAVISVITYGELLYGARKSQQADVALRKLAGLTSLIPVDPMPESAAHEYGAIRATLESRGQPIGGNDLWIAAHAKAAGLTLVTNNEKEFRKIVSLKLENWVA